MSLAYIERLPTELIELIFFESGPNLELPLASRHISAKLANGFVYHKTCTRYLTQTLVHSPYNSQNRSRLFASKWMTWDFFKAFMLNTYKPVGCLCGKTVQEGCCDAQWPPNFEDATAMTYSRTHCSTLSFVKCRIPIKLLRGPWTQDKIQFLRFLLWMTPMTVDWADPEVLDIVREGRRQAFLEKNLEAVQLFNHNRRLGRWPKLDTVRFAVSETRCDRSIVYDTMAIARLFGLKGGDWNCAELDRWCKEHIEAGDPKGEWLRLKLQELRQVEIRKYKYSKIEDPGYTNYGSMSAETGNYEEERDTLVISDLEWNKVIASSMSDASGQTNLPTCH